MMFYCVFVTIACCVLGQARCLIVSISDLCLLSYFYFEVSKVRVIGKVPKKFLVPKQANVFIDIKYISS